MRIVLPHILVIIILLCGSAYGADITVCALGCTYNNSQLQAALDAASCGDTITLEAGATYTGNFMISGRGCNSTNGPLMRSSALSWLPPPGTRVSPSDFPNMPKLQTTNVEGVLIGTRKDSHQEPPNHWKFSGLILALANKADYPNQSYPFAYNLVRPLSDQNVFAGTDATQPDHLPDGMVFDRCAIVGPWDDSTATSNLIQAETRSLVVKDSFLYGPPYYFEGHAIAGVNTTGPWDIRNNFVAYSSIPVFTGGAAPGFRVVPANITVEHNYFYRPWKWWGNPANPHLADYTANVPTMLNSNPCMKNMGEFKSVDTALWQYNVAENAFPSYPGACEGQWFGWTFTPRVTMFPYYGETANITITNSTTAVYSGTPNTNGMVLGSDLCLSIDDTYGKPCRPIASHNGGTKTITVSVPFPVATGSYPWAVVADPYIRGKDITIRNNVFKESLTPWQMLGRVDCYTPSADPAAPECRIKNGVIENNLVWNQHVQPSALGQMFKSTLSDGFYGDSGPSINGLRFEHNTYFTPVVPQNDWYIKTLQLIHDSNAPAHKIAAFQFRSNLQNYGPGGSGSCGDMCVVGPGGVQGGAAINAATEADAKVTHNVLIGANMSACSGGRDCSTNFTTGPFDPKYVDEARRLFKLTATSPYARAAHDGRDIGVNYDTLPLVNNVSVVCGARECTLEYDLTATNKDVPQVLEVSASRNLTSMLGSYTVIPALDPTKFTQPTHSERTNTKLASVSKHGLHRTWPICWVETVTDDRTGASTDLSCTANTTYYYRLMAGGDTVWGSFTTKPPVSGSSAIRLLRRVGPSVTTIRVCSGSSSSVSTCADYTPDANRIVIASVAGPYWKVIYFNGSTELWSSPVRREVLQ